MKEKLYTLKYTEVFPSGSKSEYTRHGIIGFTVLKNHIVIFFDDLCPMYSESFDVIGTIESIGMIEEE